MLKIFLSVFAISAAIAALFAWFLSLTTFPSIAHSAAGILMIAAISGALVSVIPMTIALPVWLSGFRGVRLAIAIIAFVLAFAGLILGLPLGSKWLSLP